MACVDLVAFPLQLLIGAHPDWIEQPVAVVEDERPQSRVLFVNAQARRLGVRIGQRYAMALSLARTLHASAVPPSQIERGVRLIADRLRRYSPHVEPSKEQRGVFWLDASGLRHLYPSLQAWADLIRVDLQQEGLIASIAVGFSRFGAYALATSQRGVLVCADAEEERSRVERVPLARLRLDPDVRDRLLALGIDTVGGFLRLPAGSLRTRFGAEVEALHRLASGAQWAPLVPVPAVVRHQRRVEFDAPEHNIERLIFAIKSHLDVLATAVARLSQAIVEVVLWMTLDDRSTRSESVTPAAATLDVAQLLTLVRLRLDAVQLSAGQPRAESRGIVTLRVSVNTCPATSDQRGLLPERTRRDAAAANRALARLRAELGEGSVVRAVIRDAHLPSARFAWELLTHVPDHASPRVVAMRPLVRRILEVPVLAPTGSQETRCNIALRRAEPSGSAAAGGPDHRRQGSGGSPKPCAKAKGPPLHQDSLEAIEPADLDGPYVIAGGWWSGGVRREYYFVRTSDGALLWVYFDHRRQQLFIQGTVE
jgi:protein ImuB